MSSQLVLVLSLDFPSQLKLTCNSYSRLRGCTPDPYSAWDVFVLQSQRTLFGLDRSLIDLAVLLRKPQNLNQFQYPWAGTPGWLAEREEGKALLSPPIITLYAEVYS